MKYISYASEEGGRRGVRRGGREVERKEGRKERSIWVPASRTSFSNVRDAGLPLTYEGVHLAGGSV